MKNVVRIAVRNAATELTQIEAASVAGGLKHSCDLHQSQCTYDMGDGKWSTHTDDE
jgi:hypothetical protein